MAFLSDFEYKLTPETGAISFQGQKRTTRPEFAAQVGCWKVNIGCLIMLHLLPELNKLDRLHNNFAQAKNSFKEGNYFPEEAGFRSHNLFIG